MLGLTHLNCERKKGLAGVWSLFSYHDKNVRELIHFAKFYPNQEIYSRLSKFMGEELKSRLGKEFLSSSVLCPIPLGSGRQKERGFNQSEVIAEELSTTLGVPVVGWLRRVRETEPQAMLTDTKSKYLNLRDAFGINESVQILETPRIILIDDVTTSGNTLKNACKTLKGLGEVEIWAFTLCGE